MELNMIDKRLPFKISKLNKNNNHEETYEQK